MNDSTHPAVVEASNYPVTLRAIQKKLGLEPPYGRLDEATRTALCEQLHIEKAPHWPTQSQLRSGRSVFGRAGEGGHIVSLSTAYPLYRLGKRLPCLQLHHRVARHVQQVLREALRHYGMERIEAMGLNELSCGYERRLSRGSESLSLHAWGIAFDWYAEGNKAGWGAPRAAFSHKEYDAWWEMWEAQGAVVMGRAKDREWGHVQFARL